MCFFQSVPGSSILHYLHTFPNVKLYWNFQRVTGKQNYTLFQTSNNIDIFRELLANNTMHFSKQQTILTFSESYWQTILNTFPNIKKYWHLQRVTGKAILHTLPNIKKYWHFQRATGKQNYTLFQTSNNTDNFRELLANNTTYFSRICINQCWHFQRIPSKLNYSKNFFSEFISHNSDTFRESLQVILTCLELISNTIHTFIELLPNNSKHIFKSFSRHFNR